MSDCMERWDEKAVRKQWAANDAIDELTFDVQRWLSDKYKDVFALAEQVCNSYERRTGTMMTEIQRFDFRRAFEMGYGFAKLKQQNPAAEGKGE